MALRLLSQSGCSSNVIVHCKAVSTLAVKIAKACERKGLNVDIKLVQVGALLHDIGRSKTHNVDHVVVGAEIARSLNLPESVVSIIERHAGGGITIDEARRLGWPAKSYSPQTLEEKIVTYADKLIEGSRRVQIERTIEKLSQELDEEHPSIKRVKKLHEEFSSLIGDFDAYSHTT
ncbi:MAG: TIGR00295 family protein [Candidatus Bathyarchaeaceae archaeon]